MVFSSVPLYLDPPNWNQHPNLHQGSISSSDHQNPQQLPPFPPPPHVGGGGCGGGGSGGPGGGGAGGSIRPASIADRAGLAKIPQPDTALRCPCPRCESTNTKFCYFNNYSLSQPRHFCKTCRRYWTRGGALRNVPVGGGCRRNKKNKNKSSSSGSSSKSQASAEKLAAAGSNSASTTCSEDLLQQQPQLPFLASSLQDLTQYNSGNIGLNFGGIPADQMGFQIGKNSGQNIGVLDQWRSQQFPFLAADFDESHTGLCLLQSEGVEAAASSVVGVGDSQLSSWSTPISRVSTDMAPVKMEESQGINLSRPILGVSENNNQYLGGYSWTDLSGLNSSSTSHIF